MPSKREHLRLIVTGTHGLLVETLARALDEWAAWRVVARCLPDDAVTRARLLAPELVVVDRRRAVDLSAHWLDDLLTAVPSARLVIVGLGRDPGLERLAGRGILGWVSHQSSFVELISVINRTLDTERVGALVCCGRSGRGLFEFLHQRAARVEHQERLSLLTPREDEILTRLAGGFTNRQIAEHFHLSEHTVKNHVGRILRKLQVDDRYAAVTEARRFGWLDESSGSLGRSMSRS